MKTTTRILMILLLGALIVTGAAAFEVWHFANTPFQPASDNSATVDATKDIIFDVNPGESFKVVARHLAEQGLISKQWQVHEILMYFAKFSGAAAKVRVGEYSLSPQQTPRQILAVLASGHSIEHMITIPEGSNRYEIAEILETSKFCKRADFIKLTSDPALVKELIGKDHLSLEGYLFPDTYSVTKFTSVKSLIKLMVQHFDDNYGKVAQVVGWSKGKLTDSELVTLASIIEKETGAPEERPVISSVFYNRMRIHMPLQTDPTIIYGLWEVNGSWNHNISRVDLQTPGKWNSYLNQGLPPGPISNPGFEALKAAGMPAQSDFLYFVSRNDGTHMFSKDYGQHLKAVETYQLNKKAREGKSWRDLQNRDAVPEVVVAAPDVDKKVSVKATPKKK